MKFLIYRYGSICEPDLIDSLRFLEQDVIEYSAEIKEKKPDMKRIISELSDIINLEKIDAVISVNFYPHLSALCDIYKKRYISWTVDSPVPELYSKELGNEWNRTFIFDAADYSQFAGVNPGKIFHHPLGVNTRRIDSFFEKDAGRYETLAEQASRAEVSFVGSLYSEKDLMAEIRLRPHLAGYAEGICSAQSMLNGSFILAEMLDREQAKEILEAVGDKCVFPEGFSVDEVMLAAQYVLGNHATAQERERIAGILARNYKFQLYTGSNTEKMKEICKFGTVSSATEVPVISRNSKINLNLTSKAIRTAVPWRVFDILASEGFLISNYQPELEMLGLSEYVPMFSDDNGMLALTDNYLSDEQARREIAAYAANEMRTGFNMDKRVFEMIDMAFSG